MGRPRYVLIKRSASGEFYYVLRGGNHRTMDVGKGYNSLYSAKQSAAKAHPGLEIKLRLEAS